MNPPQKWLLPVAAAILCRVLDVAAIELAPPPPSTIKASRILVVEEVGAVAEFNARKDKVESMVHRGLTNLTQKANSVEAWRSLVSTQDTVGIKVYSSPGATSGTRAVVVESVVEGLLAAGIPPKQIVVWDKHLADLRRAGFYELADRFGIRLAGSAEAGYDEKTYYETALLGKLVWGDLEFGRKEEGIGRKSFVSKLVSKEITRIISIVPLLNHNDAGVSGHLYGLALGSVDNTLRFESDPGRLAMAVPEIYALPILGDRVVLNIVDALLCQYHGEHGSLLHYSAILNQLWFSKDPVALDVFAFRELDRLRQTSRGSAVKQGRELFENAGLLEIGQHELRNVVIEESR